MSKVLVTGGLGYFGRVLIDKLIKQNFSVRVIDLSLYQNNFSNNLPAEIELVKGDIRNANMFKKSLRGIDHVIHLAALVGDTICANHPQAAYEINTLASKNLAKFSAGKVKNFIFSSTCSVYGYNLKTLNENSSLNPISLYAWSKIEAEKLIQDYIEAGLNPTIFRMSTLYGLSPRMRFDLVINRFCAQAYFDKKITLWSGKQWRPFIHIEDAADAYIHVLKNNEKRKNVIFNLGSTKQNFQIFKVANLIAKIVPKTKILSETINTDNRSYKVDFSRLTQDLNFKPKRTILNGIKEIYSFLLLKNPLNYNELRYKNFASRIKIYTLNTSWQRKYFAGASG